MSETTDKNKLKKGDYVRFRYDGDGSRGSGFGIVLSTRSFGPFIDIMCAAEGADYRAHIDNITRIRHINVFDLISEKVR